MHLCKYQLLTVFSDWHIWNAFFCLAFVIRFLHKQLSVYFKGKTHWWPIEHDKTPATIVFCVRHHTDGVFKCTLSQLMLHKFSLSYFPVMRHTQEKQRSNKCITFAGHCTHWLYDMSGLCFRRQLTCVKWHNHAGVAFNKENEKTK